MLPALFCLPVILPSNESERNNYSSPVITEAMGLIETFTSHKIIGEEGRKNVFQGERGKFSGNTAAAEDI